MKIVMAKAPTNIQTLKIFHSGNGRNQVRYNVIDASKLKFIKCTKLSNLRDITLINNIKNVLQKQANNGEQIEVCEDKENPSLQQKSDIEEPSVKSPLTEESEDNFSPTYSSEENSSHESNSLYHIHPNNEWLFPKPLKILTYEKTATTKKNTISSSPVKSTIQVSQSSQSNFYVKNKDFFDGLDSLAFL